MFNPNQLIRTGSKFLTDNAPAVLTAFGAVGVVGTAVLTAKATVESVKEIQEAQFDRNMEQGVQTSLTKSEQFRLVWLNYLPAATTGALSIGAIVMSNRISSKRAAVLAAAYALNEGKLEEYQEKVKEKLGVKKEEEIRAEINQDQINKLSDAGFAWADPTFGKVWIVEAYTGRPFLSTIETVNKVVNECNTEIMREGYIRMAEFHEAVGLEHVSLSHDFGWTRHEQLELSWSTGTSPDGSIPVHVFDYVNPPIMNPSDASFR